MHTAILRYGILLALSLGTSTATAQTELFFATGVDSAGWAQAQSNADGHVLIESPQYPRGLWLHLVDEAGEALTGILVEYQGRPDSLAAIRCVDPAGDVQETLVWTQSKGTPLRLILKPKEASDLPTGLAAIDWQIDPTAASLLGPTEETRLEGWEAMAAFLRARWQGQAGRVPVQINASTALAVEVDHPEAVETLVAHLQQMYQPAETSLGESAALDVQVFRRGFALQEGVILYLPLFADANLERVVREALSRPHGRLTLEAIASLTLIRATDKSISSLVGLENCTALTHLFLGNNQIADVKPLANLTNLIWLVLQNNNQITDVKPLANLTNLTQLYLDDNQIADVKPLANLTNLIWLQLNNNQIADATPLAELTNLRELTLGNNQITDVKPLAGLTNLRALGLKNSQITDVEPLAGLTNLQVLGLDDNQIADVKLLANFNNLQWLNLRNNQITDVEPLAGLTNLQWLWLDHNQIEGLAPLVANTGLSEGDRVYLTGNPLNDQALNEHIPALKARGVTVHY